MRFVQWPADQQQHDHPPCCTALSLQAEPPTQARASLLSSGLCHSRTYMQRLSILHKPLPFQRLSWHRRTIVSSALSETCFSDGRGCYVSQSPPVSGSPGMSGHSASQCPCSDQFFLLRIESSTAISMAAPFPSES